MASARERVTTSTDKSKSRRSLESIQAFISKSNSSIPTIHPFPHARSKELPDEPMQDTTMEPAGGNPGTAASTHHRPQRWLHVRGIADRRWELALPRDRARFENRRFSKFFAGAVSAGSDVPVGMKPPKDY